MKLDEYSVDDLHLMATAEFDTDEDTQRRLNATYRRIKASYIAVFLELRREQEDRRRQAL